MDVVTNTGYHRWTTYLLPSPAVELSAGPAQVTDVPSSSGRQSHARPLFVDEVMTGGTFCTLCCWRRRDRMRVLEPYLIRTHPSFAHRSLASADSHPGAGLLRSRQAAPRSILTVVPCSVPVTPSSTNPLRDDAAGVSFGRLSLASLPIANSVVWLALIVS